MSNYCYTFIHKIHTFYKNIFGDKKQSDQLINLTKSVSPQEESPLEDARKLPPEAQQVLRQRAVAAV
ncbi:MAG: hypothetical protein BRC48_02455, partial [Cyanobacteria bacterium QS_9_48_30]